MQRYFPLDRSATDTGRPRFGEWDCILAWQKCICSSLLFVLFYFYFSNLCIILWQSIKGVCNGGICYSNGFSTMLFFVFCFLFILLPGWVFRCWDKPVPIFLSILTKHELFFTFFVMFDWIISLCCASILDGTAVVWCWVKRCS